MPGRTPNDRLVLVVVVVVSLVTLLYSLLAAENPQSGVAGVALLVGCYVAWRYLVGV